MVDVWRIETHPSCWVFHLARFAGSFGSRDITLAFVSSVPLAHPESLRVDERYAQTPRVVRSSQLSIFDPAIRCGRHT